MLTSLLLFVVSAIVLIKSSTILVKSLTRIAIYLKVSEFVVGFLLMALATSLPELFVGISSAIENAPTLSLGNILGSNIADLTLVLGLSALIARGIRVDKRTRNRDVFYAFLSILIPMILLIDRTLSRADGAVLLIIYSIYIYRLISQRERYTKEIENHKEKIQIGKNLAQFVMGMIFLLISSNLIVRAAENLALELNLPLVLIGVSIIALGTSLPELSFEIPAMLKRQSGMAFGNILGSIVTNSTLILGVTALIKPIQVEHFGIFLFSAVFTIITILFLVLFLRSEHKLSWQEGILLTLAYLIFIFIEFSLKSGRVEAL